MKNTANPVMLYSPCTEKCCECMDIRKVTTCNKQFNSELCRTDIRLYMKEQFQLSTNLLLGVQTLHIQFKNPRILEFGPLVAFFRVEIITNSNVVCRRCELHIEPFLGRNMKSLDPNRCHTYVLSILFEELEEWINSLGYKKIAATMQNNTDFCFVFQHK